MGTLYLWVEDKLTAYAYLVSKMEEVEEFRCNVYLEGLTEGDYTTDFLVKMKDGTFMVRESVYRSRITKPMYYKLLEFSRSYWLHRGIVDWGVHNVHRFKIIRVLISACNQSLFLLFVLQLLLHWLFLC